jgi:hypothetical protein
MEIKEYLGIPFEQVNKKSIEVNKQTETESKKIKNTDRSFYGTHQSAARFIALMGADEVKRNKIQMENNSK